VRNENEEGKEGYYESLRDAKHRHRSVTRKGKGGYDESRETRSIGTEPSSERVQDEGNHEIPNASAS
jgi:hypothetical protein